MTVYELATLDTVIFGAGKAAPAIEAFIGAPDAKGRLLGAWTSDIGALDKVFLLRAFDGFDVLVKERDRILHSANPFGCVDLLTGMSFDTYKALPFLPEVETGNPGPVYEIRTDRMRLNGLAPTVEKWADAVPPRNAYSKMLIAMYSLDGPPRLTQIWPYESLAAARRMVEAAAHPAAAILVDTLHFDRSGSSLDDLAALPAPLMNYMQVCDGPVPYDPTDAGMIRVARQARLVAGDGGIDLAVIIAHLPAGITVSVEVPNVELTARIGAEAVARRALEATKAFFE